MFLFGLSSASAQVGMKYSIDVSRVLNDEIEVTLTIPEGMLKENEVTFVMPKIVPGTYEIGDFGRFVKKLEVTSVDNNHIEAKRLESSTWSIPNSPRIAKMTYIVEDTWDNTDLEQAVFEPSGTNFEANKVFVINNGAMFGYFKGYESRQIELSIDRAVDFYSATALLRTAGDTDTDVFTAKNYHTFVDSPVFISRPDTAVIRLGLTKIIISVYSPNKKVDAKFVSKSIRKLLDAQLAYLNYILPVERYNFMFYFSDKAYLSKVIGALEHSRCSLFALQESKNTERLGNTIREFVAHEFFHILTPLYVHSEEIQFFDFETPKMSKHLWMYEGVIEYFNWHVQERSTIVTPEKFLATMSEKMRSADEYRSDISFTEMSKRCLEPKIAGQYANVYEKGAVIGMCLDLILNSASDGTYNLRALLRDLAKEFGEDKAFKDEELFAKIEEVCKFPQARDFLEKCVAGLEPLPLYRLLQTVGVEYTPQGIFEELSPLGNIDLGVLKTDDKDRFYIAKPEKMDAFGRDYIKFKEGDVLSNWNGKELNKSTTAKVILDYLNEVKENDDLVVKVLRKDAKGVENEVTLSTKVVPISVTQKHIMKLLPNDKLTPEQLKLRSAWLNI